jgi:uncharacterized iron-regulated membrane protein
MKSSLRRLWLTLHLYLGLSFGIIFTVLGLTGSLLVFYIDLDEFLNPSLQISECPQSRVTYQTMLESLRLANPARDGAWRLEIPVSPARAITARYTKPKETAHLHFSPLLVSINPCDGQIMTSRFWGDTLMTWLYDLHYTLLLGKIGKLVLAVLGGFLLILVISGLVLWWPMPGKWKNALAFKKHASIERIIFDTHKLSGSYSAILLLMLILTGIGLEIPEYVNPLINALSALHTQPAPQSTPKNNAMPMSVDDALSNAQSLYPEARLSWIETPAGAMGSFRFNFRQAGEPGLRFPKTNVWVDPYNGSILAVDDPKNFSTGDTLIIWLHPLHSGEAFGWTGRIIVLITGVICPVLFVTGVIRWLQKRRAKRAKVDC